MRLNGSAYQSCGNGAVPAASAAADRVWSFRADLRGGSIFLWNDDGI